MTLLAAGAAGSNAGSAVGPGTLSFIVIAAMGAALVLLLRSMTKHLRKVREVRDAGLEPGSRADAGDSGTAVPGGSGTAVPGRERGAAAQSQNGTRPMPESPKEGRRSSA